MELYSCACCGKTYSKPIKKCEYCNACFCYSCLKKNDNMCHNCLSLNK